MVTKTDADKMSGRSLADLSVLLSCQSMNMVPHKSLYGRDVAIGIANLDDSIHCERYDLK